MLKTAGTILWTLLVLIEVAFGAYCTIVYLLSDILLGQILGIIIMLPGAAWFLIQIIKDSKVKEETKDEELTWASCSFFSETYPIIGGDGMLLIIYLNIASILCWYRLVLKKEYIKKSIKQLDISEETPDSVLIIAATLAMVIIIITTPLYYGYLLFRKLF